MKNIKEKMEKNDSSVSNVRFDPHSHEDDFRRNRTLLVVLELSRFLIFDILPDKKKVLEYFRVPQIQKLNYHKV